VLGYYGLIHIPTNIFVCYFPIEEENVMMIGTLKEVSNKAIEFIESFYNCEESEFFKKLSDIILNRCEMWSCSKCGVTNFAGTKN
jgi:predicted nucleic-acid-binding Zn-ribbon protein